MPTFKATERGYANLWAKMTIRPEKRSAVEAIAKRLNSNRAIYEKVELATGVPWFFIAIVHNLESGGDFTTHLHNGDPLTARTVHVPAGRPLDGKPPFAWERSAVDALELKELHKIKAWDVPRILYEFERYNGFGYYGKGTNSPYVWSFSNLYTAGKYVADGVYSPSAVSLQCGAATTLKAMLDLGFITPTKEDVMKQFEASISPLGALAPTLVQLAGGPFAMLAVKALAEAFGGDLEPDPEKVSKKVETATLQETLAAAQKAEATARQLALPVEPIVQPLPAPEPSVVVVQPVKPAPSKVDKALGGDALAGWKTILGIVAYVVVHIAGIMGYLAPDIVNALATAAAGWIGVALVAKLDRYLGFLTFFKRA